ncbi:MAG: YHS domain protein [Cytophagaceae bacterium]|jgi:YHS domain-containing protein|nr:YHS domain protein [Cytophagaceae bacterium]
MRYLIITLLIVTAANLLAQHTEAERLKHYNLEQGLALQGYDPVAYFSSNKAIKGSSGIRYVYKGVTYYFSSETNKKTFITNPANYEPQYGGWCAYAMGENAEKVEIDPETFKIINGKLYVFYNAYFNNTLKSWNKDEKNLKAKADKNWLLISK